MEYKTYQEWFKEIKWLKDKIILPDGKRIGKEAYITKDGFDIDGFNKFLFNTYNILYPINNRRK